MGKVKGFDSIRSDCKGAGISTGARIILENDMNQLEHMDRVVRLTEASCKAPRTLTTRRARMIEHAIQVYRSTLHKRMWWSAFPPGGAPSEDDRRKAGIAFADGMAAQRQIDRELSGETE